MIVFPLVRVVGLKAATALSSGAAHASLYVTPGEGIALQWRSANGGPTANQQVAGTAPKWVRLVRTGATVVASYSNDGTTWITVGTVNVGLPQNVLAGLPITSHDDMQAAMATLDHVDVAAGAP